MERMPIRELNQYTSAVVARVHDTGETVEITDDGEPVARIVPINKSRAFLDRMVAEGRAIAPTISGPFTMPPVIGDPTINVADALIAAREEERY